MHIGQGKHWQFTAQQAASLPDTHTKIKFDSPAALQISNFTLNEHAEKKRRILNTRLFIAALICIPNRSSSNVSTNKAAIAVLSVAVGSSNIRNMRWL